MPRKLIAIGLMAALGVCMASCSEAVTKVEETTHHTTISAETTQTSDQTILERFPKATCQGKKFRILCANAYNDTIYIQQAWDEERSGEPVNDALYKRDMQLEEYFGVDIQYTIHSDDISLYNTVIKKNIAAGEDAYDLIFGSVNLTLAPMMQAGYCYAWNEMTAIDLSQKWWNRNLLNDTIVNEKVYWATGDITTRYVTSPFLMLFNKKLFDDYNLVYPYESVYNGTWNMDQFYGIIKDTAKDLNNDTKITKEDFVGLAPEDGSFLGFYCAAGGKIVEPKENTIEIVCNNEKNTTAIGKLAEYLCNKDVLLGEKTYDSNTVFRNGNALFLTCAGCDLTLLRDMKEDYGILPLPKLTAEQENFYSYANVWISTGVTVPITAKDLDFIGTMTEAMAALSSETSAKAQYEVMVLQKQTRDEDSIPMMKIAVEATTFDLGGIYGWGDYSNSIEQSIRKKTEYASKIEKNFKKAEKEIETYLQLLNNY